MNVSLSFAQFHNATQKSKDTIQAAVLCDSVQPDGVRLTTMEWTYPRCIHSEIMTHRMFSRNAASSRAIPVERMMERIAANPFLPIEWGKNQKGMQAGDAVPLEVQMSCAEEWMLAGTDAIHRAQFLVKAGIHKQITNRLLEPWMWITIIISGTEWENLFGLRCHPAAEPHFQNLAYKARDAYDASQPAVLPYGEWHLPLFGKSLFMRTGDHQALCADTDIAPPKMGAMDRVKISCGRCARVSYLTHEGKRDTAADIRLCDDLAINQPMHASPLEHAAQAIPVVNDGQLNNKSCGNFRKGWAQYRKMFINENITYRLKQGDRPR